jgi:hypothetical protein
MEETLIVSSAWLHSQIIANNKSQQFTNFTLSGNRNKRSKDSS